MGYSNLQFGYWSRNPRDPNDQKAPSTHPQRVLEGGIHGRHLH